LWSRGDEIDHAGAGNCVGAKGLPAVEPGGVLLAAAEQAGSLASHVNGRGHTGSRMAVAGRQHGSGWHLPARRRGRSITGRSNTVRITAKGQVTIPIEIREKLGFLPATEVEFVTDGNTARLVKIAAKRARGRGGDVVARLRGTADVKMTTDQILALTRKPG